MFFGELGNGEQEKMILSPALQKGLEYLKTTDLVNLPVGRHEIDGEDIFASVSEYETEPLESKQPEAHKKYIDIQCISLGEEVIGCSFFSSACLVGQDELAERDLIFYKQIGQETNILLTPGRYAIFFPSDIHRPGCINQVSCKVKKIVIKIAVSLLK